jgi:hypothetical protein
VPADGENLFLTYVVFAYPNAANTASAFPRPPIVEVLLQGAGFDGPGLALHVTGDGTASLDFGDGRFVNYNRAPERSDARGREQMTAPIL